MVCMVVAVGSFVFDDPIADSRSGRDAQTNHSFTNATTSHFIDKASGLWVRQCQDGSIRLEQIYQLIHDHIENISSCGSLS